MQNLTEFLESNGELKAEEMNEVKGGDGLADVVNGMATITTQAAAASGGDIIETIYPWPTGSIINQFS